MTPISTSPSRTAAIETQKCGAPRAKFEVPSIGSTTQIGAPVWPTRPSPSSPMKPSLGKRLVQARGDEPFDFAVDLGEVILRPLEADRERIAIEEALLGDFACRARQRAGDEKAGREGARVDGHVEILHKGPSSEMAERSRVGTPPRVRRGRRIAAAPRRPTPRRRGSRRPQPPPPPLQMRRFAPARPRR